jgi:hypothetical protein
MQHYSYVLRVSQWLLLLATRKFIFVIASYFAE